MRVKLIRDGRVVEDDWDGPLLSLEKLNAGVSGDGLGLVLQPGESPQQIGVELSRLSLVAIHFPVLTDGRGFSYARELRERGFRGEIRATGEFTRDQLFYLKRCGFNAFQLADESQLEESLANLEDFSEVYQASIEQPEPLFRRR
ncbi:MAG: DUF934 domain-containing protein [Halieaceae bacterium]|nr:DUF934 domain-containing protein [Halieaceae bacterium]